jgi:hypothetical protein
MTVNPVWDKPLTRPSVGYFTQVRLKISKCDESYY